MVSTLPKGGSVIARSLMNLGRLESFSDGVFSFSATLLVLDFKVPDLRGASHHDVTMMLLHLGSPMLAYVTSFVVIGVIWINHHPLFKDLESVDRTTIVLNLALLIVVAFLPYPTQLIADYRNEPSIVMFYGLAQAATGIAFNALSYYVTRRYRRGTNSVITDRTLMMARLWAVAYPASALFGAGLAFVSPAISVLIYIALPLAYLFPGAIEWTLTKGASREAS